MDEFARSTDLVTTALLEAVDRVATRSADDVAGLPINPTSLQVQTVFARAREAVEWRDVAVLLGMNTPGSGLREQEIVERLAFRAMILPDKTQILTRDESGTNRNILSVQGAVEIDGIGGIFTERHHSGTGNSRRTK